jgi:hypothetical protein
MKTMTISLAAILLFTGGLPGQIPPELQTVRADIIARSPARFAFREDRLDPNLST